MASTRELTLSHFTMRHASFGERVSAAATAGFDGVGLYTGAYATMASDSADADADMLATLAAHDHRISELEALPLFRDDLVELFAHLVATFGASRVQVIPPFSGTVDRLAAAEWLRGAADRLAPAQLAIEFLPPTDLPDAVGAAELVERCGHPAVGICVDSWHVFRGAGLEPLSTLDPGHVVSLQINDGPRRAVLEGYIDDCLHHRLTPGLGEFDLTTFLSLVPDDAPIGVEVIDDDLDLLPHDEVATQLMGAVRQLIDA